LPPATQFTIDIDETPRAIFSIQQRTSGDLTIVIKQGAYRTGSDTYKVLSPGHEIREHRISIHMSPESDDRNAIVHTQALADGTKFRTYNFPRAIKATNKFAPVFIERCRDLSILRHVVKRADTPRESLGWYSPEHFQLIYGIFIGPSDRVFLTDPPRDTANIMNIMQLPIAAFRIVVVWSFLGLPSHETSNYKAFKTYPPEEIEAMLEPGKKFICNEMTNGFDEEGCAIMYWLKRQELLDQYHENRANDFPDARDILMPVLKARSRFFLHGDPNETDYRDHIEAGNTAFSPQEIDLIRANFAELQAKHGVKF
jgi:hypothetical protein